MATQEQLDELRITTDEEAESAILSIIAAQAQLRNTCRNEECMNQRRNGSAYCEKCSEDYKNNKQKHG